MFPAWRRSRAAASRLLDLLAKELIRDWRAAVELSSVHEVEILHGAAVTLRPATTDDVSVLVGIRTTADVRRWWGEEDDFAAAVTEDLPKTFAIEHDGRVVGAIQWYEEEEPMYRHAGIDIYLDPAEASKGLGTDAVRTLARHLIDDLGHHRLVIDPATDNVAAIRAYEKVGFQPVGVMRRYELGPDGRFHDGLLMDLLAEELIR